MEYDVIKLPPYIDSIMVAQMLGINLNTLSRWRNGKGGADGKGDGYGFPKPVKRTYKKCLYKTQDVIDWIERG